MGTAHFDFTAQVAVVTGCGAGIGREVTRALLAAGARVHGIDRVEGEPLDLPPTAQPVFHELDLADGEALKACAASIVATEGRVDLLVNNAGITRDHALWKTPDEDWEAVLAVNLSAPFRLLRELAPHLRERGFGRVVNVVSINALRGKFGQASYSAAKAGLVGLTRTAARELGPRGITVNAVAPGMVETAMSAALPAEILERARMETATGRLGRVEDVAAVVLFLLSDLASHVTGAVLPVDGGQLA
ncbi:MAG: SDR family oxidoreductase [Planctomycetota bacterium]|jgi:acetoacetyl-CoA reductase/3-oxoacyl-[acyl-carrier protein] reductase|nr:SDR family oxidoreductase [Planctomycetota bacterium]MDP6761496.1 SDR family oxidoreductase [Planctomycetota bacterium]MDP6988660.1 SDR family oxidoreductase [Planctomycetota bacterium]